ncbi:hypothetical protein HOK51_08125 [Candidatus Woesearchaeota archaeon]|jgi:hypothetical protein|nr:hypothetical protein [Candidatus Woesearchaeota archaeon]MBT6519791.1 hypothetical protein [Candidatus Woesearchaeota archaeon]MBT7368170.1 hypothetical protein [Candidatus Woesearchaeota archaeon]
MLNNDDEAKQKIVELLSNWTGFLTAQGRIQLIKDAYSAPDYQKVSRNIVPRVPYEGLSWLVASKTVSRLSSQRPEVFVQYLVTFRNKLNNSDEDEKQLKSELDEVLSKYELKLE